MSVRSEWERLRRRRSDGDFGEEVRSHLELETDRLVAEGVPEAKARAAAHRAFGNVVSCQERYYESRRVLWLDGSWRDVRYALRTLRRSPGFTAAALTALGLGVGVNTAVFTLLYALAFRQLPVRDADRVVNVHQILSGHFSRRISGSPYFVSYPEYLEYKQGARTLEGLAAAAEVSLTLGAGGDATAAHGQLVSCDYFRVLRVPAVVGRTLAPDECNRAGETPIAVLSHGFWQRQFGGGPVVGKTLLLNGITIIVAGVAEAGFAGITLDATDVWVPLTMRESLMPQGGTLLDRDDSWLSLVGRMRAGLSAEQVRGELALVARRADERYRGRVTGLSVDNGSYLNGPEVRSRGTKLAVAIMTVAALVVLMACANVMNLLLARAAARRKEIAVRLSVGASRRRLMAQLLIESLVLALAAGAVGVVLATALPRFALASLSVQMVRVDLTPDHRVLVYALLLSVATAVAFGLVPAVEATRLDLTAAIKSEGTFSGAGANAPRLRSVVLVVQIAGSLVLLTVAALLARGVQRAKSVDPGFTTAGVVAISLDGPDSVRVAATYDALRARLGALPGVESVALAAALPLVSWRTTSLSVGPDTLGAESGESVPANVVSATYFTTMRIPIVRGRSFSDAEVSGSGDEMPAVVSAAAAGHFWPSREPLGARFRTDGQAFRVVGVARDARSVSLAQHDPAFLYLPARPSDTKGMKILLRTTGDARVVAASVPHLVRQVEASIRASAEPLEASLSRLLRPFRVAALLASLLGLLATLVALVGVYGVASYGVAQRTREIGVRVALGATPTDVIVLVMRQGIRVIAIGLVLGLALAAAASRALRGILFGVDPLDPAAFLGTAALLAAAALTAIYRPARRAASLPPAVVLRQD